MIFLFVQISISLVSQTLDFPDSTTAENRIFEKVDFEATFPGGLPAWKKHLEKNLKPTVPIDNGAPVGNYTVVVQFIVDKEGVVSDIKALTNFGYGMEQEVIRVIQKGPRWLAANQNGRKVKAYRKQPITFVVEADGFEIIMKEKYVLYTGIQNAISINVDRTKNEDLELRISQGSIVANDDSGNYIINVTNPGRAILNINNKEKNKTIGSVYFVVKKKN